MPIIKVWCLPQLEEAELNDLHQDIVRAVVGIRELGLKDEYDMTCLFPSDMMKYGLGSEVVVEISGLIEKSGRGHAPHAVESLARSVGLAIAKRFPEAKVECFIQPFGPGYHLWTCRSYEDCLRQEQAIRNHVENWADTGGGE